MTQHAVSGPAQLAAERLYGWMDRSYIAEDTRLCVWMDAAEIGDMYEHRLGVIVRLKDDCE